MAGAEEKGPALRERFGTSARSREDACGEPCLGHAAATIWAVHSDGMRLIDDEFRAVTLCKNCEISERSAIALHAENALDDDHSRAGGRGVAAKFILQKIQVEMWKKDAPAFRKTYCVDQADV